MTMTLRRFLARARGADGGLLALGSALSLVPVCTLAAVASISPTVDELMRSGDATAQTEWARRYVHAEGVPRDRAAAVRLYCEASRVGHAPAQAALGWLYAYGRGVDRDDTLAAAWFRRAAMTGDVHAARMLARLGGGEELEDHDARCVLPGGREVLPLLDGASGPARAIIARWVEHLAPDFELDPALVLAVIEVESAFDPGALSPKRAMGLMQLIPETAERFGVRDAYDPEQNLRGGMAYLRWLLDHFDGNVRLALAGYNAGERAVARYRGVPPYAETRAYVRKVMARLDEPPTRPPKTEPVPVAFRRASANATDRFLERAGVRTRRARR